MGLPIWKIVILIQDIQVIISLLLSLYGIQYNYYIASMHQDNVEIKPNRLKSLPPSNI